MVNYYVILWTIFIGLVLIFFCKNIFRDFRTSFALAISYTILQTFFFSQYVQIADPYSTPLNMVLKIHHTEGLLVVILCVFILRNIRPNLKWLGYLCALNIILTLCLLPFRPSGFHMIGMSINPAMNASITAITLPFLFYLPAVLIVPFFILGICIILGTGNFTPILAMVVGFFGPSFLQSNKKIRNASILITGLSIMFLLVHKKGNIIDRMDNWLLFGRYWIHNFNLLIGAGNASFSVWGPVIQRSGFVSYDRFHSWWYNSMAELTQNKYFATGGATHWYWLWLHSDIYQTLWELGLIGFGLWVNCIFRVLKTLRFNEPVLAGSLAWLTVAAFYYPLHFPIQLGLGLFLISFAIKREI